MVALHTAANEEMGVPGKTLPKIDVLQAFVLDQEWAGKPFWMLNVVKFRNGGAGKARYQEYGKIMDQFLPGIGARVVFQGYARTVIGQIDYHMVAIVEYPSPKVFMEMAMDPSFASKGKIRLEGLEEQYLIPMRPGWFNIDRAAAPPSRTFTPFSAENAWSTPNGMFGSTSPGARVGETSSSRAQVDAFVQDDTLGGTNVLWHLNLLRFAGTEGKQSYDKYAKAMGGKSGVLSQFGARSTLAADCYRSLMGDFDFDQAVIAEYPCRDSFMSMGSCSEYLEVAPFRHRGLEATYIVSCLPAFVDTRPMRGA